MKALFLVKRSPASLGHPTTHTHRLLNCALSSHPRRLFSSGSGARSEATRPCLGMKLKVHPPGHAPAAAVADTRYAGNPPIETRARSRAAAGFPAPKLKRGAPFVSTVIQPGEAPIPGRSPNYATRKASQALHLFCTMYHRSASFR